MRKFNAFFLPVLACILFLCGCSDKPAENKDIYIDKVVIDSASTQEFAHIETAEPSIPDILVPEAPGILVEKNDEAEIDYSNSADGYVMTRYTAQTDKRLKARVEGPTTTYTYNLNLNEWETFPFSDGNGQYKVSVFKNVEGTKYALVQSVSVDVNMHDEFAPFLRPNQYVDYTDEEQTILLAAKLTDGMTDALEKVEAVYSYVTGNISYDHDLAASVQSGYLPDLDGVLERKKGICFDYAALMAGMLRSQSVPCKLVVGYADEAYHAWISVYSEEDGWIDNAIYFDGFAWKRLDPTFAASGSGSATIGNGTNYTEKYLY